FYGMPWVNLAGWMLTGLVIMVVLEVLERVGGGWSGTLPVRWATAYYAGVLMMPLGMVTAAGLWWSVAATLGMLGLIRLFHARFAPGDSADASDRAAVDASPRTAMAGGPS
ncbi:MAG: carotenoid biosynthesis protein, partial [Gemmatimonadetes bacterium]|nr:carotenoid biosynthesis protein [Gemmatimonadota bacterium]